MATFRAILKFIFFIIWCALLIPPQIIMMFFTGNGPAAYAIPQLWHKLICKTFQLQIETTGTPAKNMQTIYVSNHISYLDIPVISTVLPSSFVAKQEVAGWPVFGFLAKLQQTAFIDRSRNNVSQGKSDLQQRLERGQSLIIFPEGTSSDGRKILPFKSSLFSIALETQNRPQIQPFTIELCETDGVPLTTQKDRDLYTWHGEMTLMPHFWNFAKSKGAKVKLHFHPPIQVKEGDNRKELAKTCYNMAAASLNEKQIKAA